MVVAPHPDDETIGCGGLLAAHARRGGTTAVVYLTGDDGPRRSEAQRARSELGITHGLELGLPEGKLPTGVREASLLRGHLEAFRPELVCMPAFEDVHPDHRGAHRLLAGALSLAGELWPLQILTYEGFTPLVNADRWVDITSTAESKWRALACFASQDRLYRIVEVCRSLNRYRGLTSMRRAVMFAEAFHAFTVADYLGDQRLQAS